MNVKVWNDNDYELKEKFKGDDIVIKPHSYIEMEFYEAHEYRGQYKPISLDAGGQQDPKTYKKVRIEKISGDAELDATQEMHSCMKCKKSYESEPVLEAHIKTAHANEETMSLPDVDETIKRKKKAS